MPSDAQLAANRANAQHSTGPRTETGRAISSQNNLDHGFESAFRILPSENASEFAALQASFLADLAPVNSLERTLVVNMAEFQWLSQRARKLQNQAFDTLENSTDASDAPDNSARMERLLRYHTQFDRAFHRALTALMQLRAARQKEQIGFELAKQRSDAETARQKHLDRKFALEELREQRAMQAQELAIKKDARAERHAEEKTARDSAVAAAKIATETAKTDLFSADWEAHALMNAPIPGVGYTENQKQTYKEVLKQTIDKAA
jgi:hypothetical protein